MAKLALLTRSTRPAGWSKSSHVSGPNFALKCGQTKIVFVSYTQGSKLLDNTLCSGGDPHMGINNISATIAQFNIKAVLLPADNHFSKSSPSSIL